MRQSTVLRIAGQIQRIGPAAAHARQLKHELPQDATGLPRGVSRNVPTELRTQPQKDAMGLPHGVSRCVPTGLPHGVSRCVPSGLPMVLQGAGKRVIGTVFPDAAT